MVICLELGADLHMSQWMPLPLTVSCFSKIRLTRVVPEKGPLNARVCVCVMQAVLSQLHRTITVKCFSNKGHYKL